MEKLKLLIVVLLLFSGCRNQKAENALQTDVRIPVTVTSSVRVQYQPMLQYQGTAFANKEANLGTSLPGRVEKIYPQIGDRVQKGDLLAELSAELFVQAQIEANTLEKDFLRISRLRNKGSVSQQDFDHVKAQYEAARVKEELMRKNARIHAPFSGIVVDHLVKEGENYFFSPSLKSGYSMTSGIIQLMQLNPLIVTFDINEKELPLVKPGMEATVIFDAYPDRPVTGTITYIEPLLSTQTRTAKGHVQLSNDKLIYKPGMFALVAIALPEKSGVQIPLAAISRQAGTGNDYVFTEEKGVVTRVPVIRRTTRNEYVVVEGLEEAKNVVLSGKNKLTNGALVKVQQ